MEAKGSGTLQRRALFTTMAVPELRPVRRRIVMLRFETNDDDALALLPPPLDLGEDLLHARIIADAP